MESEKKRIGVFGGSFDPPHIAHFICTRIAAEKLKLEKVIVIPTSIQPHKPNGAQADSGVRWEMVNAAIKNDPLFEPSQIEIDRGGISYTVDTLEKIREAYPPDKYELYYLLGHDALADIDSWKSPDKIFSIANIAAMTRPGVDLPHGKNEWIHRAELVEIPQIEISSTLVRTRIQSGLSVRDMIPAPVGEVIAKHRLYGYERQYQAMSDLTHY